MRAGVVPALGDGSRAVVFRPGGSPLAALRAKLAQLGVRVDDLRSEGDAGEVASRVHALARARDETLVLLVDQFVETFTLARDARERAVFCAWLAGVAASAQAPVRVVLTLRDDFLAKAQQEGAFEGRLEQTLVLLATPGPAALRRILVEPARRAGFTFESEELVGEMVRAVEGRPGALALLSFAASKLWDQRDIDSKDLRVGAYEAMGGVTGALAQHGEWVLEQMTPKQRTLVRDAFRRLVTAEGTRRHFDGPRRTPDRPRAAIRPRASSSERLRGRPTPRRRQGDDGAEHVEVIHEALLAAWPRIAQWQAEDAAGQRFRDEIRSAAQQWESRRRPRGLLWRDAHRRGLPPVAARTIPVASTKSEEAFRARRASP